MHTEAGLELARRQVLEVEAQIIAQKRLLNRLTKQGSRIEEAYDVLAQMRYALEVMRRYLDKIEQDADLTK